MSVKQELITIIKNVLNIDWYNLDENSRLLGDLPEFDSRAVIAVIGSIEEHFEIIFEDEDVTADVFETVGTLASFIEKRL